MNNEQNLSSLIWSTADQILRGDFKASEYGRIILAFVVLRRLDCVLEPQKNKAYELFKKYKNELKDANLVIQKQLNLPFYNVSKFDLSSLKSDPSNVFINFQNYINGFSKNVLEIIENFKILELVKELHKNKSLYSVIDKFTEFDLHPSKIDNHRMGSLYEELLRKFSEMTNEESGDHFTPRDIVMLLVSLVFYPDIKKLNQKGVLRSVYDPCCGTGGMLTLGKEWIKKNISNDLKIQLFGQERNPITYAICKSDFLMSDENPDNIKGPMTTLSLDQYQGRKFDYLLSNPPFGQNWKKESDFIKDESKNLSGRFNAGLPRVSDGALLFLQHLVHKMEPEGSRIGIIFNGSPLTTGDADSGESNIRGWLIESDLIETIVMLPDRLFFNTGITTYIWILNNKKEKQRKNLIQLINAKDFYVNSKKKLGDKSKEVSEENIKTILDIYTNFKENGNCKIHSKEYFKYTKITIDQYLYDKNNKIVLDKKNKPQIDKNKRDHDRVPNGLNIKDYINNEIVPFVENFIYDETLNKFGYEFSLTKEFYVHDDAEPIEKILTDLKNIKKEIQILEKNLYE
jgi:type I restriction enzyme M protein